MARFDVYRRSASRYLIDVQAADANDPKRRVFVPLVTPDQVLMRIPTMQPILLLQGFPVVFLPQLIASAPATRLPTPIANLAHYRDEIVRALDVLLTGF